MGAEQVPTRGGLRTAQIVDGWRRAAIEADPALVWEHLVATGTTVCHRGLSGYPARLVDDRAAPEILFTRGSIAQLDGPCVALVGTRSATYCGSSVAAELGANLSVCRCGRSFRLGRWHRRGGSRGGTRAREPDTARRRRRWGSRRRLPREQQSALGSPRGRRGHPLRSGTPERHRKGGAFPFGTGSLPRLPMSWLSSSPTRREGRCTP